MNSTGKHIVVHKTGEEGAFLLDAMTGSILTPSNERPMWADGYAAALLAERVGWFEQRLGSHLPEGIRRPQVVNVDELSWVGVDAELNEVEIEASDAHRQTVLATLLEMDTSPEAFDDLLDTYKVGAQVDFTYETHPTDEQTLNEAQGASFETAAHAVNSH